MTAAQAPGQGKHWPPKPIDPATISQEDQQALDVRLETMARSIASAMDFDNDQRRKEKLPTTPDTHLISPPSWPSHRCLANWITCLQQARALLPTAGATLQQRVIASAAFHYFLQGHDDPGADVWGAQTDTQRLSLDGMVDCKALAEYIVKALGWHTMDTAPQNGTVILLSHIGGISLVRWDWSTMWWQVMIDDNTPALEQDAARQISPPLIRNAPGLRWMYRPEKAAP